MELRGGGFRWFPLGSGLFGDANRSAKRITFAHGAVQNRIRPCKCKFQCKRKWKVRMQTQFEAIFASVLQKYAPRSSGKHIFENQLWAIGLQKSTFWSIEGFKWGLIGPSFRYLWLSNFFFRRFSASVAHPNFEKSFAKRITFAHGAVQNRIRPCKCKFQCKRKCKFECKRNLKRFLPPFCKNMLPARAGSTFLKTNFEQPAFKNSLFGLSLIHIWRCRRYAVCRSRWSPYH